MGKDRLPEATGEIPFPIKEPALPFRHRTGRKASPVLYSETEYWLCLRGSEHTFALLPALKRQLVEGQKKIMEKAEDRDNENFSSSILI